MTDNQEDGRLPSAPHGYRFDAFADIRMGRSLFQMAPEDWLVRDDAPTLQVEEPPHDDNRDQDNG